MMGRRSHRNFPGCNGPAGRCSKEEGLLHRQVRLRVFSARPAGGPCRPVARSCENRIEHGCRAGSLSTLMRDSPAFSGTSREGRWLYSRQTPRAMVTCLPKLALPATTRSVIVSTTT